MAVSVAGGVARTRLYAVGSDPGPAFEVPRSIDVQALTDALNAVLNGDTAPTGDVDAFTQLLARAHEHGYEAGQRSLAEVS
jgi:hypothetical protein